MCEFTLKNSGILLASGVIVVMFVLGSIPTHYLLKFNCNSCGETMVVGNIPVPSSTSKHYTYACSCGYDNHFIIYYDAVVLHDGVQIVGPMNKMNVVISRLLVVIALGIGIFFTSDIRDVSKEDEKA